MKQTSLTSQFFLMFLAPLALLLVVVKLNLIQTVVYQINHGKSAAEVEAWRDSLLTSDELTRLSELNRRVAEVVSPSVVSIEATQLLEIPDNADEWLKKLYELQEQSSPDGAESEPPEDLYEYYGIPRPEKTEADSNGVGTNGPETGTNGIPVEANTSGNLWDPEAYFHRWQFHEERTVSLGSGAIIDSENGLIITNSHVVEGAENIYVRLPDDHYDGWRLKARLVGVDRLTDLAVLAIDAKGLIALPVGESDEVKVGDDVFAVGNPFGLGGSFSKGIVSAIGRTELNVPGVRYQRLLQTDAVINPGNSGGPLVNMRGQLVGVNVAIATSTGSYNGVGFAIPASRVKQVLPWLVQGKEVPRGYIGVIMANLEDNLKLARMTGWMKEYGVIISSVEPDSPAAQAGLREGDIIFSFNGERVMDMEDLRELAGMHLPGSTITLELWRVITNDKQQITGGEELTLNVTLGELPMMLKGRP